jgi:5-methyltetrahydrofolate--homocysteine methyltransferase
MALTRRTSMDNLKIIYKQVLSGDASATSAGVAAALTEGIPAEEILKGGLILAMDEVGRLFEAGEYYIPEMLIAARAMQTGLALLKPQLTASGVASVGKVVIGTIQGDLHDIGKNLVAMMLEGGGFEVIDLGTDVPPHKFVTAIKEHHPKIVGMSAMLTTTMAGMRSTIEEFQKAGVRDQVKVMVGGAPLNDTFARQIGADGYSPDASAAVRLAESLVGD